MKRNEVCLTEGFIHRLMIGMDIEPSFTDSDTLRGLVYGTDSAIWINSFTSWSISPDIGSMVLLAIVRCE